MAEKEPRSFSIDSDIKRVLEEADYNASQVVNNLLRSYISGTKGNEAALELRIQQLDEREADLEKELERVRRERERLENRVGERHAELDAAVESFMDSYQESMDVEPDNPAVVKHAQKAGVPVDRFIEEIQTEIGGDA